MRIFRTGPDTRGGSELLMSSSSSATTGTSLSALWASILLFRYGARCGVNIEGMTRALPMQSFASLTRSGLVHLQGTQEIGEVPLPVALGAVRLGRGDTARIVLHGRRREEVLAREGAIDNADRRWNRGIVKVRRGVRIRHLAVQRRGIRIRRRRTVHGWRRLGLLSGTQLQGNLLPEPILHLDGRGIDRRLQRLVHLRVGRPV